jgi:hypothetical protein
MTREEFQHREQLEMVEKRLQALHHAASEAVDRLSRLCNTLDLRDNAHNEENVAGVKVRHLRTVHQIAKELAFALAQHESDQIPE